MVVTQRLRDRRGFTLLELMIVVALIGVLAAIVIPSFTEDSNRAKMESEVSAVFAEMRTKMEAYKVEYGTYISTAADEATYAPTGALGSKARPWPVTLPAGLVTIKFVPPDPDVYCGYVAIAGPAGGGTVGAIAAGDFAFVASPVAQWYYLLAQCNMDGSATKDGFAFTSSVNTAIQWKNSGH
jgi:prepilin-type N-terminal cleavage/methylation domain-containing protein